MELDCGFYPAIDRGIVVGGFRPGAPGNRPAPPLAADIDQMGLTGWKLPT
jgi:hypothetical protein